jgi:alginate O-acetyltransferase complex protein AlgI
MGGKSINPFRHGIFVLVVFSLSGLWHGADFHFIAWGATHACLYLFYIYGVKHTTNSNKSIRKTTNVVSILQKPFITYG